MNQDQVFDAVLTILKPYVKNMAALPNVSMETLILKDLEVNSARLVDVILEIEDSFNIAVSDTDADRVKTVGDAVDIILSLAN